jgi:hypothetical protein
MANISSFLSDTYIGLQGVQGTYGPQGAQGTSPQGLAGTISTITNVGLTSITTSSYTFTQDDVGNFVGITSGGGIIPPNTFLPGDIITVFNDSIEIQPISFEPGTQFYVSGSNIGISTVVYIAVNNILSILCVNTNKFIIY